MKRIFVLLILILSVEMMLSAQNLIARQNNSAPVFYTKLDSAILNAQDGDTLYLSGGGFSANIPISKRLHLIGAGHNPDSTNATIATFISTNLRLQNGADGGSMTGVSLGTYSVWFEFGCINYFISRCIVSVSASQPVKNLIISENIIKSLQNFSLGSNNNLFSNNIIEGKPVLGTNTVFKNNLFLSDRLFGAPYQAFVMYVTSSIFDNNIFLCWDWDNSTTYVTGNTFRNNLFVSGIDFNSGNNLGSGNIINQPAESIFKYQSGTLYDYKQDYHLKESSPGRNAGTDNKDIGIYGGQFPWKEGSVPFNPHISTLKIEPKTDPNGNLKVNVTVSAQPR